MKSIFDFNFREKFNIVASTVFTASWMPAYAALVVHLMQSNPHLDPSDVQSHLYAMHGVFTLAGATFGQSEALGLYRNRMDRADLPQEKDLMWTTGVPLKVGELEENLAQARERNGKLNQMLLRVEREPLRVTTEVAAYLDLLAQPGTEVDAKHEPRYVRRGLQYLARRGVLQRDGEHYAPSDRFHETAAVGAKYDHFLLPRRSEFIKL